MGTQTYTVAQAQQISGSGLTVVDTAANIAAAIGTSLLARVSLFTLAANDAIDAINADALSTLGSRFSRGGYSLTIRDTVALLTNAANVTGVALGSAVQVLDTAANILAAATNTVIRGAATISLTTNSTVTLAQLLLLETWPSFNAAGTVITLADSAANLLALTPAQTKPALGVYKVAISSIVSAASTATLLALPGFTIATGVTLTVADTVANVVSLAATHVTLAANQAVALAVSDSAANLAAGAASLASLNASFHNVTTTLTASATVSAGQLASLTGLPHFSAGIGHSITVADTVQNLAAVSEAQALLVQAATLLTNDTATATQLQHLALLPGFSAGIGHTLTVMDSMQNLLALSGPQLALAQATALAANTTATVAQAQQLLALSGFTTSTGHLLSVTGTVADLAGLTAGQKAHLSGITADDTVADLVVGSPTTLSGVTAVIAELDAGSYTIAQLAGLAALAGQHILTLLPTVAAAALHIVDTPQNLSAGSAALAALETAGTITTSSLNNNTILSAAAAATMVSAPDFDPSQYVLAVSDTGNAITAVADSIFQHGFQAITVTSGVLAGTLAELLDPTLHFAASGGGSAELNANATVTAAQLAALAVLPNFGVLSGTILTVRDTVAELAAHQSIVMSYAVTIRVSDTASVTAAVAEQLAMERAVVGAGHFSFGGNFLLVSDTAANLIDPANGAGLALANAITLSNDSRISAIGAAQLVALGANFSPGDALLIVFDTAASLAHLGSDPIALATLNGWGALAMLSADATLALADAAPLAGLAGFTPGSHHLTISDTATALLLPSSAPMLALANAVHLAAPATLGVADASALIALHGFSTGGMALTIADTASHLLAMPAALALIAAGETLVPETAGNSADFMLTGAQLTALLALNHLDTSGFTGQITLADTATTLLADAALLSGLPGGLAGQVVPGLSADAVVTVAQAEALHALAGFTRDGFNLTISDTLLNLAGLDAGTRAMATAIQAVGGGNGSYTAAQFLTLSQTSNFASSGQVPVSDTGVALQALVSLSPGALLHISGVSVLSGVALTAAQAQALTGLPNLQAGNSVSIVDSADNLLHLTGGASQPDDWAGEQVASHVSLSGNATITAAQALQLAQLGYRFDNGLHTLTLQDTPTALLAAVSGLGAISGQISATLLAANGSPWVLSLADATRLAALPNIGAGPAGVVFADSVYNILAPANAALVAAAPGLALDGNASASVADAQALHALANFSLGTHGAGIGNQLTIIDGAGHLATLDAATAAMASSIQLQGNSIVSVTQFQAVTALPHYTDNGKLLLVSDTAANLLTLSSSNVSQATALMLSSNATLSAAQAQALTALPGFTTGIAHIGVLDTAADLLQVTGAGPMPDDWNGELAATTVTLSQDATLTASQAAELALLGSRFSTGGHLLTISDSAVALTAAANAPGLVLAGAITLAGPESLSAANATRLAAISGLSKAGHTVTMTDTAANLTFAGYAAGATLADSVQLGSATSLTVAAAEALIGMAHFSVNGAAPLTIVDTLPDLLGLAGASLASHTALLQATPIALSADAVATVAQMTALATLPEYALFSRNGHSLTIADTGRHLATYIPDSTAVPTAYVMTGDATLTAAQADVLAARSVNLDGNTLTIADTPAALLDNANATGRALADALVLSANVTVGAVTAEALAGTANFSTGGHLLTVSDTAQALLATDAATQQMASALALSDSEVVDVATLLGLTRFGIKFAAAGHTLAVADSAAQLATLNSLETALTSAQVLSTNATVSAAIAGQLAALPSFAVGNGIALAVQDSVANLLTLSAAVQAIATTERLAPGAHVTITAAEAATLATLPHFSTVGATIIVDDTIAALNNAANAGWHNVYTQYNVTDSVSNLVANAASQLLTGAAVVDLLGDTQIDAATLAVLATIPAFALGNAVLTVADGPLQIVAEAEAIIALATMARLTASTPVTAAEAQVLAALADNGKLSFASSVHVVVEDRYTALTAPANVEGIALAASITVRDTAQNLVLATAQNWGSHSPFYALEANGTVTSAEAASLAGLGSHFLLNGFTLAVSDDAASAVGSAATLTALGATVLVTDTIAQVDANSAGLIALGALLQGVNLTDTTPVGAAAAAGLSGLAGKLRGDLVQVADDATAVDANLADLQTLGAHLAAVHVTDSAANVAAVASNISGLIGVLSITLTGVAPVTAIAAAELVPIAAELAHGSMIGVSDTGAAIAAQGTALQQLDAVIGTITLSDGTTTTAAIAAALQPLDSHFGFGVQLLVHDSAAAIVAAAGELMTLRFDGRLSGMVAVNETAADIVVETAGLVLLGAHVQILDSAAALGAALDGLQAFLDSGGQLDSITLNSGTSVAVSVPQITTDAGVLAQLSCPLAVSDSAATISADLALGTPSLLANLAAIGSIAITGGGNITLSVAEAIGPDYAALMSKLSGGGVIVAGATVNQIDGILALVPPPTGVTVADTAAHIQTDLASGSHILGHVAGISSITAGSGSITLSVATLNTAGVDDSAGSAVSKLVGTTVTTTGITVSDIPILVGLHQLPDTIAMSDTATNIQGDLRLGTPTLLSIISHVSGIDVSDHGTIALTKAQLLGTGVVGVLAKSSGGSVAVSGVDIDSLDTIAGLSGLTLSIAVSDTGAHIVSDLTSGASHLAAHGALLTDVNATGGAITLTEQQVLVTGIDDGATAALAHLSSGLTVTDVAVGDLSHLLATLRTAPTEIDINDTAAHVQADLISGTQLVDLGGELGTITLSDAGTIALTGAQVQVSGVLAVLQDLSNGALEITGVSVADVAAMAALIGGHGSLAVMDASGTIIADLGGAGVLAANSTAISSVAVSDATVAVATAEVLYDGLTGASLHFDESMLTISDTATALLQAAASHPTMLASAHAVILGSDALGLLAANAATLASVLAGQLNGHTLTVVDTAAHLLDPANAVGIALADSVALSNGILTGAQYATMLAGLHNFDAGAQTIAVQDTPAHLVDPANAAGVAIATTVAPNADCSVNATTLALLAAITHFSAGGHQITLQDTAEAVVVLNQSAFTTVFHTDVADTAANITDNLDALQATLTAHGHPLTISVTGAVASVPVITVNAATFTADQQTLDAVDTAGIVRVTGSAAQLSALSATLHADVAVGEVDVIDSATNILANLPALNAIGAKFSSATVSDAMVSAAMVAGLLTIPHLQAGGLVVSDTGAQIAAAIAANGAAGVSFLNSQTVQLSLDSVVTASDALALESLTSLNKNGHLLSVWDTATHLTDSVDGYLAAVKAGIIDHVYLRTTSGTVTITASTASSLFSIGGFSKNNPDSSVNVLTVQDTAAHIESVFASLNGHRAMLSNVVVSGSSTVTDAVFGDLLSLGATAAGGVNVTVRDTAASIIAGAPSHVAGSITPSAWLLSGSATVTEAGIAYLGRLSGFSAGAYTLTLAADATISVADANAIGALGSAFRLGTHHLYVAGTVADLAGLGVPAQAIAAPAITDSFGNIAALLPSSGLLGGTITVTDSEAVSVAQAAAFLALLKVGSGSGIPAANVSFAGHVETVTDTLAHIQTLTGAAAWTQNASVQGDFSLVVADTVAHLIDPANTAALSAMAGTTLSGNLTATAADAESLFAVKNAIHFGMDGHVLTVQDTAAHLLNPVNFDGVGMASVLLLAGPTTVAAADAEALLAMTSFQLDTTLTVSDSSDALLDGTLANAINDSPYRANVHVVLSGAETLDAQTAHRLVNLPGYTGNGDLSIQDSASYLLNASNHDAEAAAISVALAGDETVSAATAVALAAVPHFGLDGSVLHLASNDFADAATLKTIADFAGGFDANGHTLTMTQDAIALTPGEYSALQADGLVGNGHALSALPVSLTVSATGGGIQVDGTGVSAATVTLYDAAGHVLTTTAAAPGFTVTAFDAGAGVNMALTETVGSNPATDESAPVVLLEQALLETIVTGDSASFAGSGAVHVAGSEYLDIYSAAAAPLHPTSPVLVYDATQHTLSLDVDGHASVILVTLGGATTAASLDANEILVKHQA